MTKTQSGGCQCGQVRYHLGDDPMMIYACHCTKCQSQSGAAFGMALVIGREAFTIEQDDLDHFIRPGHGRKFRCYFCSAYGSRIYHQWFTADGDVPFVNIKPGTLDDTSWLRPGCHVWTSSAQPWMTFGPDEVLFDEQPDLDEFFRYRPN